MGSFSCSLGSSGHSQVVPSSETEPLMVRDFWFTGTEDSGQ